MKVNGIQGAVTPDALAQLKSIPNAAKAIKAHEEASKNGKKMDEKGVVYDACAKKVEIKADKEATRARVMETMKADSEARISQFSSLVEQLLFGQRDASIKAKGVYDIIRAASLKASPTDIAKAKEDIAEDGYWGVKQTSDRIVDFAKAIAGDDPKMLQKMKTSFQKGYKMAEKKWGRELPEISKRTYDAVMEKFDNLLKTKPQA